jgi:tetratricopeptide (TPR) repeat protein
MFKVVQRKVRSCLCVIAAIGSGCAAASGPVQGSQIAAVQGNLPAPQGSAGREDLTRPPRQGGLVLRPPVLTGMNPQIYRHLMRTAHEAFAAGQWAEAGRLYQQAVAAYPYDSRTWYALAQSRSRVQDYAAAGAALARAYEIGVPSYPQELAAQAARAYARAGRVGDAATWLRIALEERHLQPQVLLGEPVFDAIRTSSEFVALAAARTPSPATTRAEQWQADLDYFVNEVRRLKLGPSVGAEGAERFLTAAAALRPRFATLSDSEALVEMQRLAALFQESHNTAPFIYSPETVGGETFKQMPIVFYIFPSGIYVIDADRAHQDLIGARVEAFGTLASEEAVRRVGQIVDRDTDMTTIWLAPSLLARSTVLHAIGASTSSGWAALRLTLRDGRRRDVRIAGGEVPPRAKLSASRLSSRPVPLYLQRVSEAFWFTDLNEETVYLQFNQVVRQTAAGETINAFADRFAAHLSEKKPKTVIVDVRHNNGGDTYLYNRLVRTLVAYDFQPDTQLYLITGRNVYSATINFVVELDRLTDAVVAGEPMGGMAVSGGDTMDIRLPYNRARMGIATSVWALHSPWDTRAWVMVDLPVGLTADDYFDNRDPVLDAVLIDQRQARTG